MAEWSIALVLKTRGGQPSVGSNPTLSANVRIAQSVEQLAVNQCVGGSIPSPNACGVLVQMARTQHCHC